MTIAKTLISYIVLKSIFIKTFILFIYPKVILNSDHCKDPLGPPTDDPRSKARHRDHPTTFQRTEQEIIISRSRENRIKKNKKNMSARGFCPSDLIIYCETFCK